MAERSPENSVHGRLQDKRKRLSPENCFYVLNWTSSSVIERMHIIVIFNFFYVDFTWRLL